MGHGQGRVHVTSGTKASSINRIAGYISKYIAKSFETGALNKRRYWASKGIADAIKTVHLLRKDWDLGQIMMYIQEIMEEAGCKGFYKRAWLDWKKGLLWIAADSYPDPVPSWCDAPRQLVTGSKSHTFGSQPNNEPSDC